MKKAKIKEGTWKEEIKEGRKGSIYKNKGLTRVEIKLVWYDINNRIPLIENLEIWLMKKRREKKCWGILFQGADTRAEKEVHCTRTSQSYVSSAACKKRGPWRGTVGGGVRAQ